MSEIRIDHSTIEADFLVHLGLAENNRILFTAPFGAGKSTFLHEALGKNKNYFTINLFPVNYSVSANEDVFELIKFDLLIELLGKYKDEIELQNEGFSALLLSQMFVLKELKLTPIIFAILKQCGKIGKSAVDIIREIKNQYDEFKTKMTEDESENIFTFLNLIQDQKGTEHEMDSISTLIKNLVERVKEKKNKIPSVLIIDDLDRLDPEHTFRLINIFSAHFDKMDNSNKFGFDKVIFVCDFENIRKIFHHKYGHDVDFSGYSDKFFSLVPYQFDNRHYIKEKVGEIIKKIYFGHNISWLANNNNRFFSSTKAVIQSLVDTRQLNLRMLFNYPNLNVPDTYFGKNKEFFQNTFDAPIVVLFYLLKNFYGSFDILRLKLEYLYKRLGRSNLTSNSNDLYFISDGESMNKTLISYCLPFILPENIALKDTGTEPMTGYSKKYDCTIHFNGFSSTNSFKNFRMATKGNNDSEEVLLNPYEVLLDVFDTCQKLGAFK